MASDYKLSFTAKEIDERLRKVGSAVLYTPQSLTPEQQAQARANIKTVATVNGIAPDENGNVVIDGIATFIPCELGNGSVSNPGNTAAVHTTNYIEIQPGGYVKLLINRQLETGCYYVYAMDIYDENKNKVHQALAIAGLLSSVYKIPNDSKCRYIRYSVYLRDSSGNALAQSITDFSNDGIIAVVQGENDFEEIKNEDRKGITDYTNVFDGYVNENVYIDNDTGELVSCDWANVTDFIPVLNGRYYHDITAGYNRYFGYGFGKVAFYDKDKKFLSAYNFSKASPSQFNDSTPTNMTSDGVEARVDGFARFQCNKEHFDFEKMCIFETNQFISTMGDMPEYSKYNVVSPKRVKQMSDGWDSLKNSIKNSVSNQAFADDLTRVYSSARYGYNAAGTFNKNKRFAMLVTTDIHRSADELKKAIDILNDNDVFDCGISLGDMQASSYSDNDGTWYTNVVNQSQKPFYTVLGNHDVVNYTTPSLGGTPSQAFNKFINPTLSVMGMSNLTVPYYYKQFDDYKICIVFLNNYDAPTDTDENGDYIVNRAAEALSQGQINWFINTLRSIPSDYHLIIARHSFPGDNEKFESEWSQNGTLSGDRIVYEDNDIISDIVNAWINGSTFEKTYSPLNGFELCPVLNVTADFSSRGKGNFIAHLVGHSHKDLICKSTKYNNQIIIGFCATAFDSWQNEALDLPRVAETKTQTAITALTYDRAEKTIRLVRIGSNLTFNLQKREYTTITI